MRHKSSNISSFTNIGSSSLLVVFLVLCLTTFALLSLSGARSDYNFSSHLADRKTAYYAANNSAEEHVAAIDAVLSDHMLTDADLSSLGLTDAVLENDVLTWTEPIDANQALRISLTLSASAAKHYQITSWQVLNTRDWEADQTIQLLPMK